MLLLQGQLLELLSFNQLNSGQQLNFSRCSNLKPVNNPSSDQCSNLSNNNPSTNRNNSNQCSNPNNSKQCLDQLLLPLNPSKQCFDRKLSFPSRLPLLALASRDRLCPNLVYNHRISSSRQHSV